MLLDPRLAVALALLVALGVAAMVAGRLLCVTAEARPPDRRKPEGLPFVSIHIATYSEPPEVVNKTLDTLARLDYPNFEVVVLDNNTPDPTLYEPVAQHCRRLGSRFRFHHYDNVKGAKAGALNIATRISHPKSEVILVLDADYCATPDLLRQGLSYFVEDDIALVQFPQAYRNYGERCGLTWEYRHFFTVYMNAANTLNTVLSTGTVLFIRKAALQAVGGWPSSTLTEDAELGLRLHQAGLRAVYVPEVTARGLMPTDLHSLRAQRRRWVLGNAQSLGQLLLHPSLSLKRKAMMMLQLTAWCNPLGLCAAGLTTGWIASTFGVGAHAMAIVALSCWSVALYLVGTLIFFLLANLRNGGTVGSAFSSFLVHLGLAWEGAFCWGEVLVKGDKRFVRTSKFLDGSLRGQVATTALQLVSLFPLAVLSTGVSRWATFCLTLAGLFLLGRLTLLWTLESVRNRTLALLETERAEGVRIETMTLGATRQGASGQASIKLHRGQGRPEVTGLHVGNEARSR